jgi:hypothetical protein
MNNLIIYSEKIIKIVWTQRNNEGIVVYPVYDSPKFMLRNPFPKGLKKAGSISG